MGTLKNCLIWAQNKFLVIFVLFLFSMILIAGCDQFDDVEGHVYISINPKQTLEDVFAEFDESIFVNGLWIIEEKDRTGTVAILPTNDVNDALAQWE